ncbi:MAG: energy transducer TonB [Spirochaetia bacterium]|nr:energy transducer TonB [Spirochaetia bacterium]
MSLSRLFQKDNPLPFKRRLFYYFRRPDIQVRLFGLALAVVINFFVFYTFPIINYFTSPARQKPKKAEARQIQIQMINLNEEKKEKKKLKLREFKPQKAKVASDSSRFQLKLGAAGGDGVAVGDGDMKNVTYSEGEVDTDPIPVQQALPKKPQSAEAAGIAGYVELEIVIDETGKVSSIKVVKSTEGYGFKEAAVNAVWTWRFKPATVKKIPVRIRVIQPINFQ